MARGYYNSGGDNGVEIAMNLINGVSSMGTAIQNAQRAEAGQLELEDEKGIRAAYEHIAQTAGQNGNIAALDNDPVLNSRYGVMAMGRYMADRANAQQSRVAMLKSMEQADDALYQNHFRPLAFAAQEAFKKGDMRIFGQLAGQLSEISPFPYKYQMGRDGKFTELFRSTGDGGFVDTGQRMTPQQVMDAIIGIMSGEQNILSGMDMQTRTVNPNFLAAAARYKMGTIMGNAQAMSDPKQWIPMQKGGHIVYAIPQNRHDDYSAAPSYRVLDERGGRSYMAGSMQDLLDQGYTRADVQARTDKMMGRGGTGGYKLTQSDVSMLTKYATSENPETGEKSVDYGKVAFLQEFIRRTGRATSAAIAAYDGNVKAAMAKGASREQAESAAMVGMTQRINGAGRATPTPQTNPANATKAAPSKADARIREAASGLNAGIPQDVQIRPPASVRLKKWQNTNQ